RSAEATPLAHAMTRNPVTTGPTVHAIDALRQMSDRGFRHLPVVKDGNILGVVSRGDFKGMELDRLDDDDHLWECVR
ncbi:MAG: CBS domain-containing protein, partial [Methyloceanibacter sp.]|nr:CBS domain-containing protein [Methyloceanibacter sp.]